MPAASEPLRAAARALDLARAGPERSGTVRRRDPPDAPGQTPAHAHLFSSIARFPGGLVPAVGRHGPSPRRNGSSEGLADAASQTRPRFGWLDLFVRTTPRDYGVLASIYARADALPAPYAGRLFPLVEAGLFPDRASAGTFSEHARDAILRR